MRFLCLHGKGTSGRIFSSQTSSFRRLLDADNFTFEFVDGPIPSTPAPDIPLFYSPPYYGWWESNTVEDIRKAHEWLLNKIEKDGPYDGVMCFSQGCALIASFILYHLTSPSTSWRPLPFKSVIFICGGMPLPILIDIGVPITHKVRVWEEKSRLGLLEKTTTVASVKKGEDRWAPKPELTFQPYEIMKARPGGMALHDLYGLDLRDVHGAADSSDVLKAIRPRLRRLGLKMVHIFGCKDPRYPQSLQLGYIFGTGEADEGQMRFDHGGGHDIPRGKDTSSAIAHLVEWCASN